MPVVQRGRLQGSAASAAMAPNLPQAAAGDAGRPCGYPAPVTTYTLRSASPAKTRADVVVVGVVAGRQGRRAGAGR